MFGRRSSSKSKNRQALSEVIFERSRNAIFLVDKRSGKYLDANPAAEELTGYKIRDLIGKNTRDITPDRAEERLEEIQGISVRKDLGEVVYHRADGSDRIAQLTVVPIDDDLVIGIAYDLSKQKEAEKGLQAQLEISRAINNILKVVNSSPTLDELYLAVHQSISRVIDTTNFFIALHDREKKRITFPYFIDSHDNVTDIVDYVDADNRRSITALIIKSGVSAFFNEQALIERYHGQEENILGTLSKIFVGVPLKVKDTVIGAIAVQSYTDPHIYDSHDLEFLETVSEAIAPAFERMITEMRLAESEQEKHKLTTAIEQSPVSILITDTDGKIEYVNPFFLKVSGYQQDEVLGENPRILKSGLQDDAYYRNLWKTIKHGEIWTGEFQNKAKDGRLYWERATIGPIYDRDNVLVNYIALKEDITEYKEASEKLEYIHELYRNAISNSKGAVYIHDYSSDSYEYMDDLIFDFFEVEKGRMNPAFLRSKVIKTRIADTDHKGLDVVEYIRAYNSGQIDRYNADICIELEDGRQKWLFDCSLPLELDGKGNVVKSLGILQDISERVKLEDERQVLEEQLRQSQKLEGVGQLAGGIAHDFNNILTASIGFTEMIMTEAVDNRIISMAAEQLQKVNERARNLVRQLLAFSRKEEYAPVRLNINTILKDLNKMLHRLIGEDIDIKMRLNSGEQPILADPSQIEQVIMNLCVNSRDAIRNKHGEDFDREIEISTEKVRIDERAAERPELPEGIYVRISVRDNGKGMDKDTLSRIFDPFFTTKEVGKGTGLGLSTVYGIVRQNSGHINVDSDEGKGTVMHVYWPVEQPEDSDNRSNSPDSADLLNGSEKILFVEDDDMVREITVRSLRSIGYTVYEADNGLTAMNTVREIGNEIDLLITDLTMPKMGGRALTEAILNVYPDMKVIFCSGYNEEITTYEGMTAKKIPLLSKPFTMSEMTKTMRKLLDDE